MQKNATNLLLFVSVILLLQSLHAQNLKKDPNLQAAYQAQGALKLDDAKRLFDSVSNNLQATKKDRCEALRALAIIHWKHYKDYNESKASLILADSIGDYKSETWLNMMRIEVGAKHYTKALKAGQKAIQLSQSEADKNYGKYKYCKVILDQAIAQLDANTPMDIKLLDEAAKILQDVLKTNPTNVNAADILFGIALLQNDGAKAMRSWLAYNRFSNADTAYDYLKPAAKRLDEMLSKWEVSDLTSNEQIALIEAIAASRFYRYARVLAKRFNLKSHDILDYAAYIEAIETMTNEYYRQVSIGNTDSGDFLRTIRTKNETLYKQIADKDAEVFSPESFRTLVRSKFGSVFLISNSSASRQVGLVLGHIVNERIRNIEQYGHKADFSFTELDMMVSNGYPSWFWENGGAGGYALRDGFLRIKTLFKFLPINAWERITDSVKRDKIVTEIKNNLLNSDLTTNIKVIRASLSKKINLDALDALYNTLVAQGLNGLELQLKFIEQYEFYRDSGTMFAHEGRHSIDRIVLGQEEYRALGSQVIEYRGRLSQIAFSPSPKLELANMLSSVSSTPTGQSNKMILDVFEAWITTHSNEIKGYNANQLPLANLYKLTDAQIITCVQAVDPFYIEYQRLKD